MNLTTNQRQDALPYKYSLACLFETIPVSSRDFLEVTCAPTRGFTLWAQRMHRRIGVAVPITVANHLHLLYTFQTPNLREKSILLVKMMTYIEKRFPDELELNAQFLELVNYVYR